MNKMLVETSMHDARKRAPREKESQGVVVKWKAMGGQASKKERKEKEEEEKWYISTKLEIGDEDCVTALCDQKQSGICSDRAGSE
jgi:hypothetical protein